MLKIENWEVVGWEHAIRGARNPMNSWKKSDSYWSNGYISGENITVQYAGDYDEYQIGPNDQKLMMNLRDAGTDHRKFMRMITVYLDITAPLYWWKEFKTYRAGRQFGDPEPDIIDPELLEMDIETNSCSTMHKIHAKEFTLEDFSCEHLGVLIPAELNDGEEVFQNLAIEHFKRTIEVLNIQRGFYNRETNKELKKKYWWQMIQLLPSSYNQKRTVMLNYEVLANIYRARKNHKLDEWYVMCDWIEKLPYSELIIGEKNESNQ